MAQSTGELVSNVLVSTLYGLLFVLSLYLIRQSRGRKQTTHAARVLRVFKRLLAVSSFFRCLWFGLPDSLFSQGYRPENRKPEFDSAWILNLVQMTLKSIPNCLYFTMFFLIVAHWASTFIVTFRADEHGGGAEKSGSSLIESASAWNAFRLANLVVYICQAGLFVLVFNVEFYTTLIADSIFVATISILSAAGFVWYGWTLIGSLVPSEGYTQLDGDGEASEPVTPRGAGSVSRPIGAAAGGGDSAARRGQPPGLLAQLASEAGAGGRGVGSGTPDTLHSRILDSPQEDHMVSSLSPAPGRKQGGGWARGAGVGAASPAAGSAAGDDDDDAGDGPGLREPALDDDGGGAGPGDDDVSPSTTPTASQQSSARRQRQQQQQPGSSQSQSRSKQARFGFGSGLEPGSESRRRQAEAAAGEQAVLRVSGGAVYGRTGPDSGTPSRPDTRSALDSLFSASVRRIRLLVALSCVCLLAHAILSFYELNFLVKDSENASGDDSSSFPDDWFVWVTLYYVLAEVLCSFLVILVLVRSESAGVGSAAAFLAGPSAAAAAAAASPTAAAGGTIGAALSDPLLVGGGAPSSTASASPADSAAASPARSQRGIAPRYSAQHAGGGEGKGTLRVIVSP